MINFEEIIEKAGQIADRIEENKLELENILLEYESFSTFQDEVDKSIKTLRGIDSEKNYFNKRVKLISVFAPINLPLFSLVIYAIVPGFLSDKVVIRPPITLLSTLVRILKLLNKDNLLTNIELYDLSRHEFIQKYASISSVVIFTGKPENAKNVIDSCDDSILFIYEGIGLNPILICKNTDLDLALEKVIDSRLFNSGQDCAGTDGILIHKEIAQIFINKLIERLKSIKLGDYKDKDVRVGRIIEESQIIFASEFLSKNRDSIVYGGEIDFRSSIVHPAIIKKDLRDDRNFKELFSPIFYIMIYENESELDLYFQDTNYLSNSMYVSIFGDSDYVNKIRNSIILKDQIILDIEDGNKEYGGYSKNSSFVRINKEFIYKPILVSREINTYL